MKKIDFNQNWNFSKCGENNGLQKVSLPHDAMLHEKRNPDCLNGKTICDSGADADVK